MLSMTQAAKTVGRSKVTLIRDIKDGKLSARKCSEGRDRWEIDVAELLRVYGPPDPPEPVGTDSEPMRDLISTGAEAVLLREQLAEARETIADLRTRLDRSEEERRETQSNLTEIQTKLLTGPKPWWKRLLG